MKFINCSSFKIFIAIFILLNLIMETTQLSRRHMRAQTVATSRKVSRMHSASSLFANYAGTISKVWNREIAVAYRNLAGLGYIDKTSITSQLAELKRGAAKNKTKIGFLVGNLFENQRWEHIVTETEDVTLRNYSYTIIRNKQVGKVVCAFSGTKPGGQLLDQGLSSGGEKYFRDNSSGVMIMEYFHMLWQKILPKFTKSFNTARDPSIRQYIFVGHSLGGAMASVAVFDSIKSKLISTTAISPVLITYGQPRTGNWAFANEISKTVPIIFRHVNKFDIIVNVPACNLSKGSCINEFGQLELNTKNTNYKRTILNSNKFYPWHLGGLIYTVDDNKIEPTCNGKSEPLEKTICRNEGSIDVKFHKIYFGYRVSDLCKPEIFAYDLNNMTPAKVIVTNPITELYKKTRSSVTRLINSGTQWLFKKLRLVAKKK